MAKPPVVGTCKLCECNNVELLDSHTLPEFLYDDIYDQQHRLQSVPATGRPRFEQKGLRERLLCEDCEKCLNIFETYSAPIIRQMQQSPMPKTNNPTTISGVDYVKFKLFLMSLLWRAGVASDEMWEQVELGPHQDKLRKMLLASDPGKPHQYGCIVVRNARLPEPFQRMLIAPRRVKSQGGHTNYFFVFAGMGWRFYASNHTEQLSKQQPFLTRAGDVQILPDFDGSLESWGKQSAAFLRDKKKLHE